MVTNMFEKYDNIPENYTPNNFKRLLDNCKKPQKLVNIEVNSPYEIINIKGELLGYSWNYGDILNLQFQLIGKFNVENNTPIYFISNSKEELPDEPQVTQVDVSEFVRGKTATIELLNFRQEVIYTETVDASEVLVLNINNEFYNKVNKGVYTLNIYLESEESRVTIFESDDCIILVK